MKLNFRDKLYVAIEEINQKCAIHIEVRKNAPIKALQDALRSFLSANPPCMGVFTKNTREVFCQIRNYDAHIRASALSEGTMEDRTSVAAMRKAAEDMNEVMGLRPCIDVVEEDIPYFKRQFAAACKLARGTDNFSEYTWSVLEALGIGPKRERESPVRIEGCNAQVEDPAGAYIPSGETDRVYSRKRVGITKKIEEYITKYGKSPFTIYDIFDYLVKEFPDRDPAKMLASLHTLVPHDLAKTKGYIFTRVARGVYTAKPPKFSF